MNVFALFAPQHTGKRLRPGLNLADVDDAAYPTVQVGKYPRFVHLLPLQALRSARMPESSNNDPAKHQNKALDLSELQNLSFGPNWSERKESLTGGGRASRGPSGGRDNRSGGGRDRRPPRREHGGQGRPSGEGRSSEGRGDGQRRPPADGQQRGERSFRPRTEGGEGRPQGDGNREGGNRFRGEGRRGDRPRGGRFERSDAPHEPPFDPVVDVLFYPEDTPFKALSHAMRSSCRTYELFEIARLILDKPDRHVIVLKPRADGKGVTQLYQSVPDGLPFASEEEAFSHVLASHLERFFEVSQEACEPPKGSFPAVSRCGITGKLLGPPNYHRYQQFLLEHHARELPNVPFEKFQARIESVKDEAVIAQWLEQMSTQTRYKLKQVQEGEQELFESLEAVKLFLTARRLNDVVRKVPQVRLSGPLVETLPQGVIRKSLLAALAHQKRFPLESANNLRGRLRRLKFTIYKRKGVSFVCAVKRNFRDEHTRFSESVQALVAFIEAHPNVLVSQLPQKYLGIELKKAERTALPAQERVPDIDAVPEEEARKIVEAHELKHHAAAAGGQAETAAADAGATQTEAAGEEATAALEDPRVRQLLNDLRWLIAEGYVTEFGDGRLYASPVLKGAAQPGDEDEQGTDDGDEHSAEESAAPAEATQSVTDIEATDTVEAATAPADTSANDSAAATDSPASAPEPAGDAESAVAGDIQPATGEEPAAEETPRTE